jgi:hypothetical protein
MTLHVFADKGLMVPETAWPSGQLPVGVHYTGYSLQRLPGVAARVCQLLHVLSRPFSLSLSAALARAFNRQLYVDPAQLQQGMARLTDGDQVVWLNPSLALTDVLDRLEARPVQLAIYFLDPVHRLGWDEDRVRDWARRLPVSTYWPAQAERLGIRHRVPYAPMHQLAQPATPSAGATEARQRDLDLVYVGSPSPKRLLWVLRLRLQLRRGGHRGFLRLASRHPLLHRLSPAIFGPRLSFAEYAALCARSRGVLELHERDAGGVTLRATLCEALQSVHLSNAPSTPQTVHVGLWRWQGLARFLISGIDLVGQAAQPPRLNARSIGPWLASHFDC